MASKYASSSAHVLRQSVLAHCTANDVSETESTTVTSEVGASHHDVLDTQSDSMEKTDIVHASIGSERHDAGECRPCAFFWKPQGCQNGWECLHCHLCSPGEIKHRKKLRLAKLNIAAKDNQSPAAAVLPLTTVLAPPPGLVAATPQPYRREVNSGHDMMNINNQEAHPTASVVSLSDPAADDAVPSVSKGSQLHSTGQCKPCAWFWHEKGCRNGDDCSYCHLCSKGEIKVRKQLKISSMRPGSPLPQPSPAEAHGARCGQVMTSEDGPVLLVQSVTAELVRQESSAVSSGSKMHSTGKCSPCAFFWKPEGCNSGNECMHCHLCPDGEKKRRKKQLAQRSKQLAQHSKLGRGTTIEFVSKQLTAQNYLIMQQQQQLSQLQMQLQTQQQMMMMASIRHQGSP